MKRLLLVALLLVSCGGGGGDSSSSTATTIPVIGLKTSTIKTFDPGDSWTYSVSATFTQSGVDYPLTGTETKEISPATVSDPLFPATCSDMYSVVHLTGDSGPLDLAYHDYGVQDGFGSIRVTGDDSSGWITTAPGYYLEVVSPVILNQSGNASVVYQDSTLLNYSYVVSGAMVNASTPLGIYETYEITHNSDFVYADLSRIIIHGVAYLVPGLGYVKKVSTANYYDPADVFQYSLTETSVLSATNITY